MRIVPLLEMEGYQLLEKKLAPIDAVPTAFPSWDRVCRDGGGGEGFARGWLVTLAARSGVGKSVLGLNMAWKAVKAGRSVYYASLEMSKDQLQTRFLAISSNEPVRTLEQGANLNQARHYAASCALDLIQERTGGVFVCNQEHITSLGELVDTISQAADLGCREVIVDYLQLAASDANDPSSITHVAHTVRKLAVSEDITIVNLSQFNRETSKEGKQPPSMYGLMGGSAIENDSNQVALIDHSRIKNGVEAGSDRPVWTSWLVIAKNRHGPTVEVPIRFYKDTLRIEEMLPDEVA